MIHGAIPAGAEGGAIPLGDPIHDILSNLAAAMGGEVGAVQIGGGGGGPGGVHPAQFVPLYGNPGDYAWGRGGLDMIMTRLLNQMDGTGPPPLKEETIDKIPKVSVSEDHIGKRTNTCTQTEPKFDLGYSFSSKAPMFSLLGGLRPARGGPPTQL